jgi:4-amino-4-deoxy-L-arabinose transferase
LNKKVTLIVFILFLLIYIVPLNVRPLVIPDETRYAEIGREMVETGNWIAPRLDGMRYFEKPVLGHWLNALSIRMLGENAFAVRLPSALAAGLSAIMLFFLVRRYLSNVSIALLAASLFLICFEVSIVGTFCVLDTIFSMFITASIVAFFFAFMEEGRLKRNLFLISAGIACGLAFLTKGFLAFVIPAIVIFPYAIWQHKFKALLCVVWLPIITAVFTALPWSIMIYLKEPDFWHYFFWVEHIDRFISPGGGQHPKPFWFFIPVILVGMLPWTLDIIKAIYRQRRILLSNPLMSFCICWFLFPFLFFSVCSGKLVTYILPCIPPVIVLFAICLQQEQNSEASQKRDPSHKVGAILILAAIIGLIFTQTAIPEIRIYRQKETWKLIFLIAGLCAYAAFLIKADKSKSQIEKLHFSCLAPLLLMFSAQFIIPSQFIEQKAPINFLEQFKSRINPNTILISDNYLIPAVCWCYKRNDVFLFDRTGEFTYGIEYDDSSKKRFLEIAGIKELISGDSNKERVILITSTKRYMENKDQLPKPAIENLDRGFVFIEYDENK